MRVHLTLLGCLPCLLAAPLLAQNIGGGTCAPAILTGTYSLDLSGRDLSSAVAYANVLQGIGTVTFDGVSAVTLTFTNNTNKAFGLPETWAGTYTMGSDCLGTVTITTGDTASFVLGAFNVNGSYVSAAYFMNGQDGTYTIHGDGNLVPATCSASTLSGTYAFNGNGWGLNSTKAITGTNSASGLLVFDGVSAVTGTWYIASGGVFNVVSITGTYTVTAACAVTATVVDKASNNYSVVFTITGSNGAFIVSASETKLMFSATGRPL